MHNNIIMPDIFFAESSLDKVQDFVKVFENTLGDKPGFIEAVAYDTAMILFQIISQPDIQFRSTVKDKLIQNNFQGVTGIIACDNKGELQKDLHLLKIEGDRFVEIER